jgi:urea transporter
MIQNADLSADMIVQTWIPLQWQAWSLVLGAVLFGAVIGSMVRRVLDQSERFDTQALAAVVGVIGGGAVTALFSRNSMLFGAYSIGLGLAFFISASILAGRRTTEPPA